MEDHTENITAEKNFLDLLIQLSDFIDEDQLGDITCSRSHFGYFPSRAFSIKQALWLGFSQPFQEVKINELLYSANILCHSFFLILWLVVLIFFSSL